MMDYHRQNHVDVKIVRIFNTYGPRMAVHDGRVVSNFIVQALKGEEITVYGDGSQTRSFCYVDDLVEGLIRMMNSAEGFHRPRQHRHTRGIHDPGTGEDADPDDRLRLPDRLPTASPGRSDPATAGHHPGPGKTRLGAPGPACGRAGEDDRLFPDGDLTNVIHEDAYDLRKEHSLYRGRLCRRPDDGHDRLQMPPLPGDGCGHQPRADRGLEFR